MTFTEQNAAIAKAVAEFPDEFGLRAFPGKRFRVNHDHSYFADGDVLLCIDILTDDGRWLAFAKGTPSELRTQMVRL